MALGATLCPWPLDRCNPPLVLYAVAEVEPCLGNRWINYLYSGISLSSNDVEAWKRQCALPRCRLPAWRRRHCFARRRRELHALASSFPVSRPPGNCTSAAMMSMCSKPDLNRQYTLLDDHSQPGTEWHFESIRAAEGARGVGCAAESVDVFPL